MAHDWAMKHGDKCYPNLTAEQAWEYADAMFAEFEKREKEEAAKKRVEIQKLLNANNTFVEREGQHFDDVEWQPDWSQAPDWANYYAIDKNTDNAHWYCEEPFIQEDASEFNIIGDISLNYSKAPNFGYQGDWRDSLRMRPEGV